MSKRRNGPSFYWRREHGTKIIHGNRFSAFLHTVRLIPACVRYREALRLPYRCTWGQWYYDGRVAPVHWHVGRRPKGPQ